MREIKFRGKRVDNNEWIYGTFIFHNGEYKFYGHNGEFYEVTTETIGQFTGLKDKNGKEIYEDDIVQYRITIKNYDDDEMLNPRYYATPQFQERVLKSKVSYNYNSFVISDNTKWNELQVIGNIHENPELLK